MKKIVTITFMVLCLLTTAGCGRQIPIKGPSSASSAGTEPSKGAPHSSPSQKDRVSSLLNSMTIEQRVGQLFFVRCPQRGAEQDITTWHLGGYLLFGRDFQDRTANEIIQKLNAYQEAAGRDSGVPLLIGTDEEGGSVVRLSANPRICAQKFRSPQQLFAGGGMDAITANAHEKDVLLRALGINVNFAPVADVSTNSHDFIFARSFGQDASSTGKYVAATIDQMNRDHMGSVLKHFPGYGNNTDTHTGIAVDNRPIKTFASSDFLPFQSGIGQSDGKTAVLVSHNIVKAMDPALPASLCPAVHKILRRQLGFSGVIMTDDLAMAAVQSYAGNGSAALMALKAGNDMVLTSDYRTQIPQILAALEDGRLSERDIDAACRRVLLWKQSLGMLTENQPYSAEAAK